MPSMNNLKDFAEIIEPGFVDKGSIVEINGTIIGDLGSDDGFDISGVNPIEVPMVDGSIGVFDCTGEFMGFMN